MVILMGEIILAVFTGVSTLLNFAFVYILGKKDVEIDGLRHYIDLNQPRTSYYEARIALLELQLRNLQEEYSVYQDDLEDEKGGNL